MLISSSQTATTESPMVCGSRGASAVRRNRRRLKPRNRLFPQNDCYRNSPFIPLSTKTVWGLNAPQRPGRNVRASTASIRIGETDADIPKSPRGEQPRQRGRGFVVSFSPPASRRYFEIGAELARYPFLVWTCRGPWPGSATVSLMRWNSPSSAPENPIVYCSRMSRAILTHTASVSLT